MTVFLNPSGRVTYFHQGAYQTEGQLIADVRRYAQRQ